MKHLFVPAFSGLMALAAIAQSPPATDLLPKEVSAFIELRNVGRSSDTDVRGVRSCSSHKRHWSRCTPAAEAFEEQVDVCAVPAVHVGEQRISDRKLSGSAPERQRPQCRRRLRPLFGTTYRSQVPAERRAVLRPNPVVGGGVTSPTAASSHSRYFRSKAKRNRFTLALNTPAFTAGSASIIRRASSASRASNTTMPGVGISNLTESALLCG